MIQRCRLSGRIIHQWLSNLRVLKRSRTHFTIAFGKNLIKINALTIKVESNLAFIQVTINFNTVMIIKSFNHSTHMRIQILSMTIAGGTTRWSMTKVRIQITSEITSRITKCSLTWKLNRVSHPKPLTCIQWRTQKSSYNLTRSWEKKISRETSTLIQSWKQRTSRIWNLENFIKISNRYWVRKIRNWYRNQLDHLTMEQIMSTTLVSASAETEVTEWGNQHNLS